jgi:two-component system, OmpR family, sensor histidine kinase ChvG
MIQGRPNRTPESKSFFINLSNRMSLTTRILLVNVIAILVFIGGLLFLDSYRERLLEERARATQSSAEFLAAIGTLPSTDIRPILLTEARTNKSKVRLYDAQGRKIFDSVAAGEAGFVFRAPETDVLKNVARQLDLFTDRLLLRAEPRDFKEPTLDTTGEWAGFANLATGQGRSQITYAPDASPVVLAMARSSNGQRTVLVIRNPKEVRTLIRAQRFNIMAALALALFMSVAMSLFLARTLVRPLRALMVAAMLVKRGRAREVSVPRLPQRRDEIGLLARALSDMSQSLRDRIDATEAFAADVAHEIKNPLASLRSALESMRRVDDPNIRMELQAIAEDDVRRMDRLISDISDASRVDSELTRARFEPIDIGCMIEQIVIARDARPSVDQAQRGVTVAYARPRKGSAMVFGEDMRLARVLDNLIDNAISFSPDGGVVEVVATVTGQQVLIRIRDDGPGVPVHDRDAIFRRFHTNRPHNPDGMLERHSGLGLSIARTIVQGHLGQIEVFGREDGLSGAVFEVRLPCADCTEDT